MATITTLRPSVTSSGVGWTATPSGTLHGVTSDDSDSTYALWSGAGSPLILATPSDAPPAGERRHLVRLRARGSVGAAWWAVRLPTGILVAGASGLFGPTPETVVGSWQAGAPHDGSQVLSCYVEGQTTNVRLVELFLDVDTRAAPDFTAQVLNGAGDPDTTIADTVAPVARVSALDLDGLPARQYRYWVVSGSSIVWDTGTISGPPVDRQIDPLPNGTYTLRMQVWSTLGANTANPSAIEEVSFTMAVGAVPSPSPPAVTPEEPFYRVEVCAPDTSGFDDYAAWIEVQRVDCPHGGFLDLPGTTGNYASAPDAAPLDITGDLEVTVLAQRFDGWRPQGNDETMAAKYVTTGDQRSWRLGLDWDGADNGGGADQARAGRPMLAWSPDGTLASLVTAFADERAPIDPFGRVHLRVFLDVDDGAGGWAVTFETLNEAGEWVQLGEVVDNSGAGTTSIHSGTAPLAVGAYSNGAAEAFEGRVYSIQVRSGRSGPVVASPDFTSHPAGTTTFDDQQGNAWTINGVASLESSQQITSVAMLGPLESDECTEWVDFTVPRSGVGRSCDHQPEPCCSYWRARTVGLVDGSVLVSDWSDAFNPGIPPGVIFMWPGADADIPAGWSRTTELDDRYVKGIPDGTTQPGALGGSATHLHFTLPGHSHDITHSHTSPGPTGSAVGTRQSNDGTAGTLAYPATHTHTRPSTGSASVSTTVNAPDTDEAANDPDRLVVVWIESTGQPLGVPTGALAFMPDISPSNWSTYADATDRFFRGAAPGGDGGAVLASELAAHTHDVLSHQHSGTSHTHSSANTGSTSGTLSFFAGPNLTIWASTHNHPITISSASSGTTGSSSGGTTGGTSPGDPPYRNLRVRRNDGGPDLPVGLIAVWLGSIGSIPDGWALCDGTGGTPDLFGLHPRGATAGIEGTGGSAGVHTHTTPAHTHTSGAHSHGVTIGASAANQDDISATAVATTVTHTHTHSATNTDSATPTVGNGGAGDTTTSVGAVEPPYREAAFIQLMEVPEPPAEPETFCLEWTDNEHLLRTLGPNGPMYVGVPGMFEWTVDRPFTAATGVNGGRYVTTAPPGGRNIRMTTAVESDAALDELRAVLARPLVLISPSDSAEVWGAPVSESFRVVKIGRIRQVTGEFVATGPEPPPQIADIGA